MHIYNSTNGVISPDLNKVLYNKKTKTIRTSQFKLSNDETIEDYIDVYGIEVQGQILPYNPNDSEYIIT